MILAHDAGPRRRSADLAQSTAPERPSMTIPLHAWTAGRAAHGGERRRGAAAGVGAVDSGRPRSRPPSDRDRRDETQQRYGEATPPTSPSDGTAHKAVLRRRAGHSRDEERVLTRAS